MSRVHTRLPEKYDAHQLETIIDALQRQFREALTRTEHIILGIEQHLILRSPDGHYWKIEVSNLGALTTTDLGTSIPN